MPKRDLLAGIRAVAFDAVGTLITPDPPVPVAYEAIGREFGSRHSADALRPRFRAAFLAEEERDRAAGWRTRRRPGGRPLATHRRLRAR